MPAIVLGRVGIVMRHHSRIVETALWSNVTFEVRYQPQEGVAIV